MIPLAQKNKLYEMKDVPKLTGLANNDCLIIGAGAAPWTYLKRNAEVKILSHHNIRIILNKFSNFDNFNKFINFVSGQY